MVQEVANSIGKEQRDRQIERSTSPIQKSFSRCLLVLACCCMFLLYVQVRFIYCTCTSTPATIHIVLRSIWNSSSVIQSCMCVYNSVQSVVVRWMILASWEGFYIKSKNVTSTISVKKHEILKYQVVLLYEASIGIWHPIARNYFSGDFWGFGFTRM